MHRITWTMLVLMLFACEGKKKSARQEEAEETKPEFSGKIERRDGRLNGVVSRDATIEVLAEGFDWTEGPLWVEQGQYLLFSGHTRV